MAVKQYLVSDTEMEIMEVLWEKGLPVKSGELLELFNERGKNWKRQTMNTFLTRLKNKGLIETEGKTVRVLYDREEYQKLQAQKILNDMYEGDIKNFIVAFAAADGTKEEEEELLHLIDLLKKEKTEK